MRILMIAATYPPTRCGVGDYARRVAMELTDDDTEVFVLTGASEDLEHDHGDVTVATVQARPTTLRPAAVDFDPLDGRVHVARAVENWDWSSLEFVEGALASLAPDVVSLQYHGEDYLLHPAVCSIADLAAARGIRTVTTLHNLQQPLRVDPTDDPLDHLLRTSEAWICTNTIDEKRLAAHDASSARLHRIPTGPCITADSTRRDAPIDGPLRLGYFGFLNPFKGIEFLLRATAAVRDAGIAVELEMAAGIHTDAPGRLREYAAMIDREIVALDLDPILRRQGFAPAEEVARLLGECHLAVFPFREGLSGKNSSFWSTMHHATPTLTTRGAGLPAGLVDGDNTLLAQPEDADDLARQITWAATHRDELEAIGARGRSYVEDAFAWSTLAGAMREVFARDLSRRTS